MIHITIAFLLCNVGISAIETAAAQTHDFRILLYDSQRLITLLNFEPSF